MYISGESSAHEMSERREARSRRETMTSRSKGRKHQQENMSDLEEGNESAEDLSDQFSASGASEFGEEAMDEDERCARLLKVC